MELNAFSIQLVAEA